MMRASDTRWKLFAALVGAGVACGIGVWAGCELALAAGWSVGELAAGLIATGVVLALEA